MFTDCLLSSFAFRHRRNPGMNARWVLAVVLAPFMGETALAKQVRMRNARGPQKKPNDKPSLLFLLWNLFPAFISRDIHLDFLSGSSGRLFRHHDLGRAFSVSRFDRVFLHRHRHPHRSFKRASPNLPIIITSIFSLACFPRFFSCAKFRFSAPLQYFSGQSRAQLTPPPLLCQSHTALSYGTRFRWIFSEFWTRRRENFEAYSENISSNFHKAAVKIQKKGAALEFRNSKHTDPFLARAFSLWEHRHQPLVIKQAIGIPERPPWY